MADNLINVNAELEEMKKNIADVDHCTSVIGQIKTSAFLYQSNVKTNVFTILCTVYALCCAVLRYNVVLLGLGAGLAVVIFLIARSDFHGACKKSRSWNILLIGISIYFFMIFKKESPAVMFGVPGAVLLFDWIYTFSSNQKFKKLVWKISYDL